MDKGRALLGANPAIGGAWDFSVWAPDRKSVAVRLIGEHERVIPLAKDGCGYHRASIDDIGSGARYLYQFDDSQEYPDPASRFQPDGVHKPSATVDLTAFEWSDDSWQPPSLKKTIFYELHVGTFSKSGTLDGARERLADLADLGVTTVELMPLAQFPGSRNWGYDGVYPFAVQNSYGGPVALQQFVNDAHKHGLAVCLDMVYNHIGPEGNYLSQFGPYFTDKYRTPWGQAINFDDAQSGGVRSFFKENALFWFEHFHVDALRLDAVHGYFDFSAYHFLAELERAVELLSGQLGRPLYLIAESDLNDARILRSREQGGYAIPAQWSDDFHHSIHTLLTSEVGGYYADFGGIGHLSEVLRDGWSYHGQYSKFRRRRHGNSPCGLSRSHFVVFSQNHDQVGNRARGERLSALVDCEAQKLAAGATLFSPFVPLLFMGEEYGETAPFQYFTSHGDKELIEAVRRGRQEEFASFSWETDVPDPQADTTFENSKLRWQLREKDSHRALLLFYRELIRIRKAYDLGADADWKLAEDENLRMMTAVRTVHGLQLVMLFNFSANDLDLPAPLPPGNWITVLNSASSKWLGHGSEFPSCVKTNDAIGMARQSFVMLENKDN